MLITKEYLEQFDSNVDIEDECWLPAYGYEGKLEVSSYGNIRRIAHSTPYTYNGKPCVRSYPTRIYSVRRTDPEGYLCCVALDNKQLSCHRLVAKTFLTLPDNYRDLEVDHIDFCPGNPYYKNLQWLDPSENRKRSLHHVVQSNGRPVRNIVSGQVYPTLAAFCESIDCNEQAVRYGINEFKGYVPLRNVSVEYYPHTYYEGLVVHEPRDSAKLLEGQIAVIRRVSHKGVRCLTTGEVFPTAISASLSFGLPPACVGEVIEKFKGYYKKRDLTFEYIDWSQASIDDIKIVLPHFVDTFAKKRGGRKVKNEATTIL